MVINNKNNSLCISVLESRFHVKVETVNGGLGVVGGVRVTVWSWEHVWHQSIGRRRHFAFLKLENLARVAQVDHRRIKVGNSKRVFHRVAAIGGNVTTLGNEHPGGAWIRQAVLKIVWNVLLVHHVTSCSRGRGSVAGESVIISVIILGQRSLVRN